MRKGIYMQEYLVFDIGGTFIKYSLMNERYNILEQGKIPSPVTNLDDLLAALEQIGRRYAGRYEGIAVSMPGRIDTQQGIAYTGGVFLFIRDVPFASLLRERLGVPVVIANDGKCAANAELLDGALANVDSGAVLVLGTGTGGGIILNRKVWMGHSFAAGEFSFLPSNFQDFYTYAKNQSSELISSVWGNSMSATGLLLRYAARKGLPTEAHGIDGYAFFASYDLGEPEAKDALAEFGRWAAVGIYALQSVLDLERYAIGGGISSRIEVTDAIRTALNDLFDAATITPFSRPELVRCRYGSDANLLGALRFYQEALA